MLAWLIKDGLILTPLFNILSSHEPSLFFFFPKSALIHEREDFNVASLCHPSPYFLVVCPENRGRYLILFKVAVPALGVGFLALNRMFRGENYIAAVVLELKNKVTELGMSGPFDVNIRLDHMPLLT